VDLGFEDLHHIFAVRTKRLPCFSLTVTMFDLVIHFSLNECVPGKIQHRLKRARMPFSMQFGNEDPERCRSAPHRSLADWYAFLLDLAEQIAEIAGLLPSSFGDS
jgi:hypothetical protein